MEKIASIKTASLATKQVADAPQELFGDQFLSERDRLQLHQRLLGTLDVGTLIHRFFYWMSEKHFVGGIEHTHPIDNIIFTAGSNKQHKAKYTLHLEQHYLGELCITSQKRFSEQDFLTHEQSLGIIVHYLKNAIDHQTLEKTAFHDALTGAMNRTALEELLPKEIERTHRFSFNLAVMMIDIDHFKAINDRIGHVGGDDILRHVSAAIKSQLRKSDLAFRYGGDEFLLVLPNTDLDSAHQAAKRIMEHLNNEVPDIPNCSVSPELSIGITIYQHGESHDDLIRRVDNALYDSKNNGRNCIS